MPPIHPITNLKFQHPVRYKLDNGIPVYELNAGTQEVFKLELLFFSGRPFEKEPLLSRATAGLLKEGTIHFTAAQLAERIDYFGASLLTPFNLDTSSVVLYGLNKHLPNLLPLMEEVIKSPTFPEQELEAFVQRIKQKLKIELSKIDVVGYRTITEAIFGATHPYGYNSVPEMYDQLTTDKLKAHHKNTYHAGNCILFVSGKLNASIRADLNKHFGNLPVLPPPIKQQFPNFPAPQLRHHIHLNDGIQTAIRIGKPMFSRKHPDYIDAFIVNTLLGGYFGSRLMTSVREKYGFTYNIYSSIDPMLFGGYFYISTEVGNDYVQATFDAIYQEMNVLQQAPPSEAELQMLKNYLLGNFLNNIDGAFNTIDLIKTMVIGELGFSFFDRIVERVRTISGEEIQAIAQRLFGEQVFSELTIC